MLMTGLRSGNALAEFHGSTKHCIKNVTVALAFVREQLLRCRFLNAQARRNRECPLEC